MKEILVAKNAAMAGKVGSGSITKIGQTNVLIAGSLAFFNETGAVVDGTSALTIEESLKGSDYVIIGVGNATGGKLSQKILRSSAKVDIKTYVAGTAQDICIGYKGTGTDNIVVPSSFKVGDEILLKIEDRTNSIHPNYETYKVSVEYKVGDTISTILDRLVAKHNALPNKFGTLSKLNATSYYGLKFRGVVDRYYSVTVDGFAAHSLITTDGTGDSTVPIFSQGLGTSIIELEKKYLGEEGILNTLKLAEEYNKTVSNADPAGTYKTYSIIHERLRSGDITHTKTAELLTIVAIPSGATDLITAFEAILNVAFKDVMYTDLNT